jgi:hypothetical protein
MSDMVDSLRYLTDALSTNGRRNTLLNFLAKLNIKSAQMRYSTLGQGAPLIVEDLQMTIDAATFDMAKILLHKKKP